MQYTLQLNMHSTLHCTRHCILHCTIHCIISASLITADRAYRYPVGSIRPFFFDRRNITVEHFCTCANILKECAGIFLKDFDTGWVTGRTQNKNVIRSALQGSAS